MGVSLSVVRIGISHGEKAEGRKVESGRVKGCSLLIPGGQDRRKAKPTESSMIGDAMDNVGLGSQIDRNGAPVAADFLFASLLLGVGPNVIRLVWRNLFPQAHYAVCPTFQN